MSNLSQQELALSIGVTRIQVSRYEVSGSIPKDPTFKKILEVLKVSEDVFWSTKVTQHELTSDFAARFKYFRSKADLTQGGIAKLLGLSTKQISDYEVSRSQPRPSTFVKILEILNTTEEEFWDAKISETDITEQQDFPSRLIFFRKRLRKSQTLLASDVGVSTKQISDYEVGLSKPRQATFNKILGALGIDDILFWTTDIHSKSHSVEVVKGTNHSGLSNEDVNKISERVAIALAEKTGISPNIAKELIKVELKSAIFGI